MATPVLSKPPPPLRAASHLRVARGQEPQRVFALSNSDMVSMDDEAPPASSISPIKPPPLPRRSSSVPAPQDLQSAAPGGALVQTVEQGDEEIHVEVEENAPAHRVHRKPSVWLRTPGIEHRNGFLLMLGINAIVSIAVTVITLRLMVPENRAPVTVRDSVPSNALPATASRELQATTSSMVSPAIIAAKPGTAPAAQQRSEGAANPRHRVTNRARTQSATAARSVQH